MYSLQYTELDLVCKYLLTIPLTQVTCERAFSKLKIIKSRLRAKLTDEHLEALFMMQCERDVLIDIDNDVIIDRICRTSKVRRRLLVL